MTHLTEQQILEYVVGDARPEWNEHVDSCLECAARARGLSGPLRLFADSVREMAPGYPALRLSRQRRYMTYWPAFIVAALLLLIAAPFYRGRQTQATQSAPAMSDEVLLQRVQKAVRQSVPGPMAPLAVTFASDSGNTE